jgi:hypothetical protein
MNKATATFVVTALLSGWCITAVAQAENVVILTPRALPDDVTPQVNLAQCGPWTGHYGPIDYRSAAPVTRKRVETHHFDTYLPQFYAWLPGQQFSHYIAANFSYTLRAFPNHPVTLLLMEQIGRRLKTEMIPGSYYPLECWYLRGMQAVPDDAMVRAQYGIYLAYRGRTKEALYNLEIGEKGLCRSPVMQHYIGLAHLAAGADRKAQVNAMRSEQLGFSGNVLRRQLEAAKKWDRALESAPARAGDVCEEATAIDEPTAAAAAQAPPASAPAVPAVPAVPTVPNAASGASPAKPNLDSPASGSR